MIANGCIKSGIQIVKYYTHTRTLQYTKKFVQNIQLKLTTADPRGIENRALNDFNCPIFLLPCHGNGAQLLAKIWPFHGDSAEIQQPNFSMTCHL